MRIVISFAVWALFVPAGCYLGFTLAYYLGDRGEVASALLAVATVPLGIVLGFIGGAISAAKLAGSE